MSSKAGAQRIQRLEVGGQRGDNRRGVSLRRGGRGAVAGLGVKFRRAGVDPPGGERRLATLDEGDGAGKLDTRLLGALLEAGDAAHHAMGEREIGSLVLLRDAAAQQRRVLPGAAEIAGLDPVFAEIVVIFRVDRGVQGDAVPRSGR